MKRPSAVVGIVSRNRSDLLPQAIRSALAQTGKDIQVAVLDDASTDSTPDIRKHFPNVQWTRSDCRLGLIEARNHLMRSAQADYFISLDDDAYFLRGDEISIATQYLDEDPLAAAIAFDVLSPDRTRS